MKTKNRFSFWRVFWVVTAVYLFFMVLAIVMLAISPVGKTVSMEKLFRLRSLISQAASFAFGILFFYFTLNIFYRLIASRSAFINYLKPLVLMAITLAAYYSISNYFFSPKKIGITVQNTNIENEVTPAMLVISYTISSLFFIGVSYLVAYLTHLRDERKQRKVLEEQKLQLEMEKSQANLNFLKAQINPHFLHNTLNFLYAKSLPYSPELSEGILTLSDIMRYALSEGTTKDGKAPLKDEIEHVRNVIKINQLRFSNNLNVQFDVEGVVNGSTIIPFVLITLVENAFKHGDLKDTAYPIEVLVQVQGKHFYFYCRNKKKTGPKELSTGVGLDNIRKRLELAYGKSFSFDIKDETDFYTTELTIDPL
jgi:LytS/YehU family sensor histidine kinase